jgi:GTPase
MSEQAKRREKASRRSRVTMANPQGLPTVAIVGRPNVGKSTLMNRIIGHREAIVEERPGVTRDRKDLPAEWIGVDFMLTDTGGWMETGTSLDEKVSRQSEKAMDESDIVIMVVDVTVGVTDEDERVADLIRRRRIDRDMIFLAVNKVDGETRDSDIWDFSRLGLGDPYPISALHGRGSGDFLDLIVARLPTAENPTNKRRETFDYEEAMESSQFDAPTVTGRGVGGGNVPAVVIAGRPNVGKSTLFNRLIGDDRSVVHDLSGTTRDSIDTVVTTEEGEIRFIDTAGMRKKSKIDDGAEYYSLVRALQAIDRADAALFVIDATEGITHQDQRLAERIDAAGCPIVILLNKWDLVTSAEKRADLKAQIVDRLGFIGYAPVLTVSALSGAGMLKLMPTLAEAITKYHMRVPTKALNNYIHDIQQSFPGRDGKVLYATQGATDPPTFTLFSNRTLSPQFLRFLEKRLREHFGFGATPIKLRVRKRGG